MYYKHIKQILFYIINDFRKYNLSGVLLGNNL